MGITSVSRSRYGEFRIIDTDSLISVSLQRYGEWAQKEIDLFSHFIQPGAVILDVGAFIGTHARAFSELVGASGKVLSFEPRHAVYSVLLENVKLAPVANIQAFNVALGSEESCVKVPSLDLNSHANFGAVSILNQAANQDDAEEKINITTLDTFGLDRLDFMKIDVEGMEVAVLNGAKETVQRCRPVIFAECNSIEAGSRIVQWAQDANYQCYGVLSDAYNPHNFAGNTENIFGEAKETGLLLIPAEESTRHETILLQQRLPAIRTADDLALLLLSKPQYPYEVLASTEASKSLTLLYPSPQADAYRQSLSERESQIVHLTQAASDYETQIADLTQAVAERDNQIVGLHRTLSERDHQIVDLNQAVTECDHQIIDLIHAVLECEDQIADLHRVVTDRDHQIVDLTQSVAEHDTQIADLRRALAERDHQIVSLNQTVTERDEWIHALLSSRSWKITRPMRWVGRLARSSYSLLQRLKNSQDKSVDSKSFELQPDSGHRLNPTDPVAVILPVYRNVEMTRRCILAAMPGVLRVSGARLLAINDASPDDGMQSMLDDMANTWPGLFVVLRNESNQGFVRTVNRGLEYFEGHDVVLLNSDVIVPEGWLQRLRDEAYSRADIGTVTPLTNNGTICSFPRFLQENGRPFDLDVDTIDSVFRHFRLPNVDAPTGVGFCMYIRRACLDEVGLLNEERFGRGYGEENDLCQRALKKNYRNLITPNLYVFHEGSVSFSTEKHALIERAMQTLDELHPNYHADVQKFINDDPLKPARVARYIQLLSVLAVPKVLHVSHKLGGGVKQHVHELAEYFSRQAASLLLTPDEDGVVLTLGLEPHADRLVFRQQDYPSLLSLLKGAGVSAVHFHHTLGLNALFYRLPFDLGVKHVVTVHDYYWLSANPTLTDANGVFSGHSDDASNPLYPIPEGHTPATWREHLRPLIEGADCVIFPSSATKDLFKGHYQIDQKAVVAPHIESRRNMDVPIKAWAPKDRYVIGILGAVGREKGADYLEQIALHARRLGKPYDFKLIGYAYRSLQSVHVTGPYQETDLSTLIQQEQLDLIFFPALWPETYSYTLSTALDSGLPIVAPNLGAFPERLSARPGTMLYPFNMPPADFLDLLDGFIAALSAGEQPCAPVWQGERPQRDFYEKTYIAMMGRDLQVVDAEHAAPVNMSSSHASPVPAKGAWKEVFLLFLWRCYMHPSTRWLSRMLPYAFLRATKRLLSRRPIHEIARGGPSSIRVESNNHNR